MKTDVEIPDTIPVKRRQLQDENRTPNLFIRAWLDRDDLTPSQRSRLDEELTRRRKTVPLDALAIIRDPAGVTPQQRKALHEYTKSLSIASVGDDIKEANVVVCLPKETRRTLGSPVWEAERYARHRKLPVKVILPNGEEWNELGN